MKKAIVMMLCLVLTISFLGCDDTQAGTTTTGSDAAGFRAGFAREKITPSNSEKTVIDDQYVSCVAIADAEGNTLLMLTCDTGTVETKKVTQVLKAISEKTDVPVENITCSATHTHSSGVFADNPNIKTASVDAAVAAIEDLTPATMYIGTVETDRMSFVRHYNMSDGTIAGDNFGVFAGLVKESHTCEADRNMRLIRFTREEGNDIVMMNWQAHPTLASSLESQSSDYIAPLRSAIEDKLGCSFIFFQGACGNVNARSRIESENVVTASHAEYGEKLAEYAINNVDKLEQATPGAIQVKTMTFTGDVRKDDPEVVAAIPTFESVYAKTGSRTEACAATGGLINSPYAVSGIAKRTSAGDTKDLNIGVISIGNVSFVTAPYEMFTENGQYIQKNTPFDLTFIMGYTNGHNSYIPSQQAFDYGCYEKDTGFFAAGTGEKLADTYISMLKELKGE